ncbi:MAG: MATE family efflux transporter [Ignavibacteriaceae bacterium]|nr:MATE family efflux transporter [Ignavibacteriaceae bacterium]
MNFLPRNGYYKRILHIALPAIAGLSSQMIVSIVDAAIVGRLGNSEYALAAMGIGVLATWVIVSFLSSLATGTHILVARRYGEHDLESCSNIFNNSLLLGFFLGIIITLLGMMFADDFAQLLAKDHTVGDLAGEFIFYRVIGIPFFLITVSFRGFLFGIGNTRIFMFSAILVNVLNIVFNYIFVYGKLGMPAMGVAGSGLGSSLATICDAAYYFIVTSFSSHRRNFSLYRNIRIDTSLIRSIFSLSLPVSFQNIFILIGFLSFVAITGLIGTVEQAASQAVISALFLSFLPTYGFGIAVQTLVGNNIGKGKMQLAKIFGFETAKIATYYTSFLALIFIFFPELILIIITTNKEIIDVAIPALRIAGFAQVFYSYGVVLANGLQSMGKTKYVMYAEVFANLILFVPFAYIAGVVYRGGLSIAWMGLNLYVIVYTIFITYEFKKAKI